MQFVFSVPENDAFDFQPDSQALQSILSNTGISFNQMSIPNTTRVTLADGRLTPYRQARQSFREVRQPRRLKNPAILFLSVLRTSSSIQYLSVVLTSKNRVALNTF